jgi:hypothetical protein
MVVHHTRYRKLQPSNPRSLMCCLNFSYDRHHFLMRPSYICVQTYMYNCVFCSEIWKLLQNQTQRSQYRGHRWYSRTLLFTTEHAKIILLGVSLNTIAHTRYAHCWRLHHRAVGTEAIHHMCSMHPLLSY